MKTIEWNINSDVTGFVKSLKRMNIDFITENSNYTFSVKMKNAKHVFLTEQRGPQFFQAASLLNVFFKGKSEIIEKIKTDPIFNVNTEYFNNRPFLIPFEDDFAWCFDIKSAYPTVLKNSGFLPEDIKGKLDAMPKELRLAALGSLASTKTVIWYEKGKAKSHLIKEKPTKPIFMYCVKNIDFHMQNIAEILGKYYIFYWVDGIYFKKDAPPHVINKVENYLMENNFEFSAVLCFHFSARRKNELIFVNYEKDGNEIDFCFPDKEILKSRKRLRDYFNKSEILNKIAV
jgi:hypothetical protein